MDCSIRKKQSKAILQDWNNGSSPYFLYSLYFETLAMILSYHSIKLLTLNCCNWTPHRQIGIDPKHACHFDPLLPRIVYAAWFFIHAVLIEYQSKMYWNYSSEKKNNLLHAEFQGLLNQFYRKRQSFPWPSESNKPEKCMTLQLLCNLDFRLHCFTLKFANLCHA